MGLLTTLYSTASFSGLLAAALTQSDLCAPFSPRDRCVTRVICVENESPFHQARHAYTRSVNFISTRLTVSLASCWVPLRNTSPRALRSMAVRKSASSNVPTQEESREYGNVLFLTLLERPSGISAPATGTLAAKHSSASHEPGGDSGVPQWSSNHP